MSILTQPEYICEWMIVSANALRNDPSEKNLRLHLALQSLYKLYCSDQRIDGDPIQLRYEIMANLEKVADQNPLAMFLLGLGEGSGFGRQKPDKELSKARIVIAAKVHHCPEALNYLALRHAALKNFGVAVQLFELAAQLGYQRAHKNLGGMFLLGLGVEHSYAKSIQHLECAGTCAALLLHRVKGHLRNLLSKHERANEIETVQPRLPVPVF